MESEGTAAIVTGAASGLGAATAAELAGRGVSVFALDLPAAWRRAPPLTGVQYVAADVTDPVGVQAVVDAAAGDELPLRIVVNCARAGWTSRVLSKKGPHDLDLFRKVVDINLVGTFNVLRLATRRSPAPSRSSTTRVA